MNFELTKGQLEAIEEICKRYINGHKHTVISGPAGSGKSSLVNAAIQSLSSQFGIHENEIVFATYTGKAALVLRKKGNKNVKTLHKLLYNIRFNNVTGEYTFVPIGRLDNEYKIIVCDECSMIPLEMIELLAKSGCYIILLGDSHQLPPIDKDADNHLLDSPHVELTEIVRQESESEIIQVATAVREGKKLKPYKGKEVQIIKQSELSVGMLLWADQILCSTNHTRREINSLLREQYGFTEPTPMDGDKVICLHNYWEVNSSSIDPYPLMNGTIGTVESCFQESQFFKKPYYPIRCHFTTDIGEDYYNLLLDNELFETGKPTFKTCEERGMKRRQRLRNKIPLQFDYGYAITIHKAQGSEWNKVLIIEEGFPYNTKEHMQSLYTAITRAKEKVVIVLKD